MVSLTERPKKTIHNFFLRTQQRDRSIKTCHSQTLFISNGKLILGKTHNISTQEY